MSDMQHDELLKNILGTVKELEQQVKEIKWELERINNLDQSPYFDTKLSDYERNLIFKARMDKRESHID